MEWERGKHQETKFFGDTLCSVYTHHLVPLDISQESEKAPCSAFEAGTLR